MKKTDFIWQTEKLKNPFLLLLQRLLITFELFNRNGLTNHAAACAYGFLLSAAPALLFVAFFISRVLSASPELTEGLFRQISSLFSVFNVSDLIDNFLSSTNSGLAGLISVITMFWTARLCALSAQRGLGVIFPGSRSVFKQNAVTLGLGILTIIFIFTILLGFRLVLNLYQSLEFLSTGAFPPIMTHLIQLLFLVLLALLALAAYRFAPANPPKLKNIIPGVLACILFYRIFTAVFAFIIDPGRYNLLYGTLGRLFLFLVNVYFFFTFFFFGAQLIQMLDISDALLFTRFRKVHSKRIAPSSLVDKIFASLPGPLNKYSVLYKKGDFVFSKGSQGKETYYVLSGEAGVYLDDKCQNRIALIDETHFFGEMAFIASEGRAASIKAETDLSVLSLPPELFHIILQIDPDTDQSLIRMLSDRLKTANQQVLTSDTD